MKSKYLLRYLIGVVALWIGLVIPGCQMSKITVAEIKDSGILIQFDGNLFTRVTAVLDGKKVELGDFTASEYVVVDGQPVKDFAYSDQNESDVNDNIGRGKRITIVGNAASLRKTVQVTLYEQFPGFAITEVMYTNTGNVEVKMDSWVNNHHALNAVGNATPAFWSFQSGSYESRADWVLPLEAGFEQDNYMGMNASDYGGGTPVIDVWRRDAGLGVGHVEKLPRLVSLPVQMPSASAATLGVRYDTGQTLSPGKDLATFKTFVTTHSGDYFATLLAYRRFMQAQGIQLATYPESSYEPIWCAWGFERNFTMKQIYGALPKVVELGFKWAVLDDGWQTAEGDWYLTRDKFPRGDRDMLNLTQTIRKAGLRPKLWWAPLAVDPGTDLIKKHEDYLLLNKDGSRQKISWWNAYYLCPAYPPVQEYTRNLVEKMMKTWGYDGLKIDGQHLNAAPPCYNPKHNHVRAEEGYEGIPAFFKVIYETALSIKPDAVVEICPCGTAYAFHTMPFMNQPVSSDPLSSWQIRLKGKTLKALMGVDMPYYGDHVELSDGRDDFASTVGIGGVIGTKFTWPVGAMKDSKIDLTPAKEKIWKKWVDIYTGKMLSKGKYRGELYDLGFDRPETHAVEKDNRMYYALYAEAYQGDLQLRGLGAGSYRVMDYENAKDYGTVQGPQATIKVDFENHLLLEAVPAAE